MVSESGSETYNEENFGERKKKNRKIMFAYVSEHCASFGTTIFLATFGGEGWGMGLQVVF